MKEIQDVFNPNANLLNIRECDWVERDNNKSEIDRMREANAKLNASLAFAHYQLTEMDINRDAQDELESLRYKNKELKAICFILIVWAFVMAYFYYLAW